MKKDEDNLTAATKKKVNEMIQRRARAERLFDFIRRYLCQAHKLNEKM